MRSPLLKLAALGALVALVGAAAVPAHGSTSADARDSRAILDAIPPVALGAAELRVDADDSGRVVAELSVGDRGVRGTFDAAALTAWTDSAAAVAAGGVDARTPVLRARDGQHFVLASSDAHGERVVTLYAATDDSLFMLHAAMDRGDVSPAIGTLRHAAKVAKAVAFVTKR